MAPPYTPHRVGVQLFRTRLAILPALRRRLLEARQAILNTTFQSPGLSQSCCPLRQVTMAPWTWFRYQVGGSGEGDGAQCDCEAYGRIVCPGYPASPQPHGRLGKPRLGPNDHLYAVARIVGHGYSNAQRSPLRPHHVCPPTQAKAVVSLRRRPCVPETSSCAPRH